MNGRLVTAKLLPTLGVIPLGAAVSVTFMQRDPARIWSRRSREDRRDRRRWRT
jgi:hypothetical protein